MLTVQEQDRQLRDASMREAALTWLACGILWVCLLLVQRFGIWGLETSVAPLSGALAWITMLAVLAVFFAIYVIWSPSYDRLIHPARLIQWLGLRNTGPFVSSFQLAALRSDTPPPRQHLH